MLEIDWVTILFESVNFLVIVVGLSLFVFKPLRSKLSERGQAISEALQNARDQEAEANRLRAEWEEKMRVADQQAEEIIQSAEREGRQRMAALLEEARQRADRLADELRADLLRQRDELVAQHYDDMLDAIVDLSANVVRSVTTRRTHDDLVSNFCASIYQLPQEEVTRYREAMVGRMPVAIITTPVALADEQRRMVVDTLSSLMDRRIEVHTEIDPALVAGIQVRVADQILDNSVRQHLNRVRERVRDDLTERLGAIGRDE